MVYTLDRKITDAETVADLGKLIETYTKDKLADKSMIPIFIERLESYLEKVKGQL